MDDFLLSNYLIKEVNMTSLETIQRGMNDALVMEAQVTYEIHSSKLILFYDVKVVQKDQVILKGCFKVEFTYQSTSSTNQRQMVSKAVQLCQKDVLDLVSYYMELLIKDKKEVH